MKKNLIVKLCLFIVSSMLLNFLKIGGHQIYISIPMKQWIKDLETMFLFLQVILVCN